MQMTLKEFAGTAKYCPCLGTRFSGFDWLIGTPGIVYVDYLFIQQEDSGFHLSIANWHKDGSLSELEKALYDWACAEGIVSTD